jgi:hypothetical protein
MKKLILSFLPLFFFAAAFAQMENPVKWTYSAKKIRADIYELHMTAMLEPKWHIYSQDIKGDGPVPTSIAFDKNPLIKPDGKVAEMGTQEKEYDKNFGMTLKYYDNKVDFVQKIKLKAAVATVAKGKITYMVCNEKKCLPPKDIPFSIKIDPKS